MDLKKLKGINWVGNIYQKFEVICQEVDDLVSQDTIKYVETQVQTVGKNVKKLSGAVQDLLPTLGKPVKHGAKDVGIKDISAISAKSGENLEEKSLDAIEKQSPREPNVMDPLINQLNLVSRKYYLADEPTCSTSAVTFKVSEADLSVPKIDEDFSSDNLGTTEKQSPSGPDVMDPVTQQLSLISCKNHLAHQPSSPTSVDNLKVLESHLFMGRINKVLTNDNLIDAAEKQSSTELNVMDYVPNQLSLVSSDYSLANQPSPPTSLDTIELPESNLSVRETDEVLENQNSLDSDEKNSLTEPNVMDPVASRPNLVSANCDLADQHSSPTSTDPLEVSESDLSLAKIDDNWKNESSHENNEEISVKVSAPILFELTSPVVPDQFTESPFWFFPEVAPKSPAHGLEFEPQHKPTVNSDEFLNCSGASNATSEMAFSVVSGEYTIQEMGLASFSSPSAKESCSPNAPFSCNSVEVARCMSDGSSVIPSSALPLTVSSKDKDGEMILSLLESVEGTSRNMLTMPLAIPSGKQQFQICESDQYGARSSDESSCDSYSRMETIDLHDKVNVEEREKEKLEESHVIVEDSVLHAISCRARKLRSYKKRIQDAFTSKKRLEKEYEQLAIWFGDTDIDFSQETVPNSKILQTLDVCDSEWELL